MNEKLHVHMRRTKDYKFEITYDELPGVKVVMDEPSPLGASEGPNASMMLSSAVGHCLSASLLFCMQKSRVEVKDLETHVETSLERNERGRWRVAQIKVKMKPVVDASDREKLERCIGMFEDFCIVSASVRQGVETKVEIER